MIDTDTSSIDILVKRRGFTLGPIRLAPFESGVTVVVGDNGAGKSTFFDALQRHEAYSNSRVAFLPQTFSLPPFSKVCDAFAFVASRRLDRKSDRDAEVERVLALVDLDDKANVRFRTLSGGMHRRAGLGMTLIGEPDLVILDEPTVGLDLTQREQVLATISRVGAETPVLMSSHISDDLESVAARIIVLADGQLVFDGSRADYLANSDDATWVSAYRHLATANRSSPVQWENRTPQ